MSFAVHRDLQRAIVRTPRDRAARAVYADWLEERADPRAPFFRQPPGGDDEGGRWDTCGGALVNGFAIQAYRADVPGVLTWVRMPASRFVQRGDALIDTFPLVAHVLFELADRGDAAALAATPALARLPSVAFTARNKAARLGGRGLATFAASPHLGALAALGFDRSDVGAPGVVALAKARPPALRELAFDNDVLAAKAIAALVKTSTLALDSLSFTSCRLDDDAIARLAAWPQLVRVRALALRYDTTFGDAALVALARSPYATNLETLDVVGAHLGPAAARAMLDSPHLAKLARWELSTAASHCKIRDDTTRRELTRRFAVTWL